MHPSSQNLTKFRVGILQRKAVIWALINREIISRFGKSYFGYVWIFLEPALHIAMWVLIFGIIRQRHVDGMSIYLFLLTGVVPFLYIQGYLSRCVRIINTARPLLNYQPVKVLDAPIATQAVDSCITIILFIIGMLILMYINDPFIIYSPLRIIYTLIELALFLFGAGLIFSIFGYYYIDAPFVTTIIMRILYFTSGAIIPLDFIPTQVRIYLELNPFYQIISLIRSAFLDSRIPHNISNSYVCLWVLFILLTGLTLYFVCRHNIQMNARAR